MIYLFTVACTEATSARWWSALLASDRSHCFDRLTGRLEPEEGHAARLAWLSGLSAGADEDTAARHAVLRGFPAYLERHWEESRFGPHHVGNADHAVQPLLLGLWLLWPAMRFVFAQRDGVSAVAAELEAGTGGTTFETACRSWAARAELTLDRRRLLERRGASVLVADLDRVAAEPRELERVWTAIPGDWERYAAAKRDEAAAIAAQLRSPAEAWESWTDAQREQFTALCGPAQRALGYRLPGDRRPIGLRRSRAR